jgi:hypothetical protein
MHRILISALAVTLLLAVFAHATDASSLPSRKASVVLPLLKQFSSKNGYAKILQILGKEDLDDGSAFLNCIFKLDDGTSIEVEASPNGKPVYYIHRRLNDGANGIQVIYENVQVIKKDATHPF